MRIPKYVFCVINWNKRLTLSFDIIQFFGRQENVYKCTMLVNMVNGFSKFYGKLSRLQLESEFFFEGGNLILDNVSFANGLFISVVRILTHL